MEGNSDAVDMKCKEFFAHKRKFPLECDYGFSDLISSVLLWRRPSATYLSFHVMAAAARARGRLLDRECVCGRGGLAPPITVLR